LFHGHIITYKFGGILLHYGLPLSLRHLGRLKVETLGQYHLMLNLKKRVSPDLTRRAAHHKPTGGNVDKLHPNAVGKGFSGLKLQPMGGDRFV
jgi:hypothetical protein